MFFRVTELFTELLTDRNLPYAQNCAEFDLFNGNCKNCWNSKMWSGGRWTWRMWCVCLMCRNGHTVRNDSLRGSWFAQSWIGVK